MIILFPFFNLKSYSWMQVYILKYILINNAENQRFFQSRSTILSIYFSSCIKYKIYIINNYKLHENFDVQGTRMSFIKCFI